MVIKIRTQPTPEFSTGFSKPMENRGYQQILSGLAARTNPRVAMVGLDLAGRMRKGEFSIADAAGIKLKLVLQVLY
jgi:hypothetical protein